MLRAKLEQLGVRRMLLAIHDVSFPCDPDEDLGRGCPASAASARLFPYIRDLGFTGIQLGPQGQTARTNPSPYDGTIFSRHLGNIATSTLRSLVGDAPVEPWLVRDAGPAVHKHAHDASHTLVELAYAEYSHRPDVRERLDAFKREHAAWLESDALYAAISNTERGAGFRDWAPGLRDLWLAPDPAQVASLLAHHAVAVDRYAFGQMLVHEEHARVRERTAGLKLYGDLQVGYADADAWRWSNAFLRGYLMGAPPSRTNPEGQPWGYPVLDPLQYRGAARELVRERVDKAFREYDSIRIDHPHGLVCPWVYRSQTSDPMQAVRDGARLFESPDLDDHPELAQYAIVRADQLDRARPRYSDDWVRELDDEQKARYAAMFDEIVDAARRHGRSPEDISCEVLSTMPAPLACMLLRHGLGRWRVTQKANLADLRDVYRTEHVGREDWMMLGNHDTAPIRSVIAGWSAVQREAWARHLSARLFLDADQQQRLARDGFLATCMLAELFVSRAENVSIFFADLFGYTERFNVPGLVADVNWTLRLLGDFERVHADRLANEAALDVPLAADLALAAQRN